MLLSSVFHIFLVELTRSKLFKKTAYREDSAQSSQSLRCSYIKALNNRLSIECPAKTLISLRERAGWSESSLGTYLLFVCFTVHAFFLELNALENLVCFQQERNELSIYEEYENLYRMTHMRNMKTWFLDNRYAIFKLCFRYLRLSPFVSFALRLTPLISFDPTAQCMWPGTETSLLLKCDSIRLKTDYQSTRLPKDKN